MAKADGAQAGKTTNTEPSGAATPAKTSGTKTSGAKASGAKASGAKTSGAKASGTKTSGAKASGAKASGAKTSGAKASGAKASGTKASGAKASGAKTSGAKPRFGAKFLEDMRRKLLKERAKYLHSAEEYQAEAESLLATREPGDVQFDEEGGEGATVAVERERDLALSSQARHTVSQIDAALERIDNGTYGYCITSGAPIPVARLRAIPWAAERVEVKAGGLGRR